MSADAKTKPTLTSKLRAKKVTATVPQKREPELKPELFTELKNVKKARVTSTKKNKEEDATNQKKSAGKAPLKIETEQEVNRVIGIKKPKRTTKSAKIESDTKEVPLEIVLEPKTSTKNDETDNTTAATSLKIEKKSSTKRKSAIKEEGLTESEVIKQEPLEEKWEPKNWRQLLDNIRSMRSGDNAPVDTMGCHMCADENADEKTQRFHKLVALMLSSQTKDETTYHAMLRLREHTLTPESICEMKVNVLENMLHPVSFYKNKAKYLQQTSKILIENYNSDIPNNIKELVALPGVGPKMAHICMSTAWHQTTGIGVDVHVHRICNRLQLLPKPTKEPEQTRLALESWLPRDLWKEVNHLLVGFGQTTCTPVRPKCADCLNRAICPSAPKSMKSEEKMENLEVMKICDKSKFKKTKMHL